MGIRNLKTNLESINLLEKNDDIRNNYLFLDFNCLFYTYAHVSKSDIDLYNKLIKYLNYLLGYINDKNKLYIFYDSGYIKKKEKENKKRKLASNNYYDKIKKNLIKDNNMTDDYKIKVIESITLCLSVDNKSTQTLLSSYDYNNIYNIDYECINMLDINSALTYININDSNINYYTYEHELVINNYDITSNIYNIEYYKESDNNDIQKKIYSIQFNLDSDKKSNVMKEMLCLLKKHNFNILTEKNKDAEVYMITKAIELYNKEKEWPIFHTKDQDVIALLIFNSPYDTNIIFNNNNYKIIVNNISKKIVLLSLIFNDSDYFGGIKRYIFDNNKCKKIISNKEFNESIIDYYSVNDIKKLCLLTINITKTNIPKNTNIDENKIIKYLNDILLYLHFDDKFYETNYNDTIDIYEFTNYLQINAN